jgi:alkanesulfonate monooxygenase SsuD/methylene tetrahydromethanopterin reductase-like flavin-dependent oxidoreductase (luciferase family)
VSRERPAAFRPTRPPPGRLVRLGVTLDRRLSADRLREVAITCERAGVDAVWLGPADDEGSAALDSWAALAVAAAATERVRLGITIETDATPPPALGRRLEAVVERGRSRLELGLRPGRGADGPGAGGEHVARARAAGVPVSIEAADPASLSAAVRLADDVVVPPMPPAEIRRAVVEVRAACQAVGRDPGSLGIALRPPVSIGRTSAEARARAEAEPLFARTGPPAEVGIFGRLEDCQDQVLLLADLGVTDLRAVPPGSPDLPDVIAQLTAMVRALRGPRTT